MLQVSGFKAWICLRPPTAASQTLQESRKAFEGDHALGFVDCEDAHGLPFCIRYSVPDCQHDYSIRAVVDGKFKAARALSRKDPQREGGIASIPCSKNGEKAQHFVFDLNEGSSLSKTAGSAAGPMEGLFDDNKGKSLRKTAGKATGPPSIGDLTVGTIKLTFSRCQLQEVIVGSESVHTQEPTPASVPDAKPTHRTRLGMVQFEAPRRAYRAVLEDPEPWITFQWVYGSKDFIDMLPHGEVDVNVDPHRRSLQDIHLQDWFGLRPEANRQDFSPPTVPLRPHGHVRSGSTSSSKSVEGERRLSLTRRISMSLFRKARHHSVDERGIRIHRDPSIPLEAIDSVPPSPSSYKANRGA